VTRVFIVAASPLARAGLENLLAAPGVSVVGAVPTLEAVGSQLNDTEPDVILLDASGERLDTILESLAESGLASESAVVVLADHPDAQGPRIEALRSGVRALLPSDLSHDQLVAALQAAAAGLVVMHPREVAAAFPATAPVSQPLAELAEPLTRREREVLQMLAAGLGNKEIAAHLNISDHTVKFHVTSILGKLGASTRTEAVSQAIRRNLVLL
jgi:DNA-binding NarL/FixJ family response regulator